MRKEQSFPEKWKNKIIETEDQLQVSSIMMMSQEFPQLRGKFWHTKNEVYIEKKDDESKDDYEKRCSIIRGKFKAMGLLAGIMDILVVHNGILYKIELKLPGKRLSDNQEDLHSIFNSDCPLIKCKVAYSLEEVYEYCQWIVKTNYEIDFNGYRKLLIKVVNHTKDYLSKDDLEFSDVDFTGDDLLVLESLILGM